MPWRTVNGTSIAPKATPKLDLRPKGIYQQERFLTSLPIRRGSHDESGPVPCCYTFLKVTRNSRTALSKTCSTTIVGGSSLIWWDFNECVPSISSPLTVAISPRSIPLLQFQTILHANVFGMLGETQIVLALGRFCRSDFHQIVSYSGR